MALGVMTAAAFRGFLVNLDAIEAGRIKPREIDQIRANRLLKSGDPAVKTRAEKLLASAMPADRVKVFEDYKRVLAMQADPHRGAEVQVDIAEPRGVGRPADE